MISVEVDSSRVGRGRAMGSIARSNAIARGRWGGAIDDRSRVDGDERARSNARSIAIRRWAEGKIWCVDGVCVCVMFDGGMWGVYMGRVDGWREDWEERDARLSVSLRRFVCLRSRVCVVMTDRGVVLVCVCSFV